MSRKIATDVFTSENPVVCEAIENRRLTPESRGLFYDTRHIILRFKEEFPYVPGQSVGVQPPGVDEATGKPHKINYYSIASAGSGDRGDRQTISLCVSRQFRDDPQTGRKNVPGICSNYLCDLKPGDSVKLTGPFGHQFILPDDFQSRDFVFAATGTGIAPYRGMLREMFDAGFERRVWLCFGVQYSDCILYDEEFEKYRRFKNFYYLKAASREDKNPIPETVPTQYDRMYIQVRMYLNTELLGEIVRNPASMVYLCGLKGMEDGIFSVLDRIGSEKGMKTSVVATLKEKGRLKLEVH